MPAGSTENEVSWDLEPRAWAEGGRFLQAQIDPLDHTEDREQ